VEARDEGVGVLAVHGTVDETDLLGPRLRLDTAIETEAGFSSLEITDRITNIGDEPTELQLIFHSSISSPLVAGGSPVIASA